MREILYGTAMGGGVHCLLAVGERRGWEALRFVVGEV